MSTNRARSAALVLSAFIVWPFLSNAASAAMLLSSTANPSSAAAGDRVRFAATVSNTGPTVQAVALTAVVPVSTTVAHNELSFAAYCNGVSNYTVCTAGQTLQFVAFNVPVGGSVTVVYPALVSSSPAPTDGTKLTSTATATIGTSKLQAIAFATASTSAHASLHLTSSALPAQVRAGGTLTYTLTFANPGSAAAAANLTLPLPAGTTFVSASDGGTNTGGVVTWSLGTVAPGSAGRRSVVLQVASTAVAGTQLAGDAALRSPTTQAVIAHAALSTPVGASPVSTLNVRAVATPDPVAAGQRVRYAVTVSNTATATHAVLVVATVPLNTTVAHNELSFAAYCDGASNYVTCTAGQTLQFVAFNVPAGGSVTVIYPALVSSTAPPNGTLVNSDVWVQDSTAIDDYQVKVAAVAQSTAIAGLHVTTSALPAQVRAGGTLTYTLTFANPGSAAVAANLTLPLPAGTTFVSASDGGTSSGGTVTWSLGTVAAGSAGRRTVVLQVASTAVAGTQLAGDAALRSPTTQAVIAHAALSTPVGASPVSTLNVRVVATPDPVAAGQRVSYAVTVSNTATATHAVLVAATVPLNATVAHNELSFAAYCDGASNYVTCTAGQTLRFVAFNVPAGGSVTVIYPALVSSTAPPNGTLVNSDVWVQDGTTIDDYQVKVAAVVESTATAGLHVTTSALPAQVRAGGTLTYTLTFANPGSAAVAANLTLPLPAGTTFVSASDGGTSSGGTVTWSLGTVAAGSAGRRSVVLQVASTAVAGTQLAGDAALRSPTTQAVIAHAALTTPVGASPVSTLNVRVVATPDPVAAGQRVSYAVTVSNTATATHAVLVAATVPLNATVAHNELSFAAYCDGASNYVTCTAGQSLQFVAFNVPAGGSVTVIYPALVSSTAPPNGTLVNSDVWVQDSTAIDA